MTALDRSSSGVAAIGLVVHPTRDVERPLSAVREWARERGVALGQVDSFGSRRPLGPAAEVADCDLVVAIGGDGTTLAAIRAAAPAARPVLGVACGSLGALTAVPAGEVGGALERFARGDWVSRSIPALRVTAGSGARLAAYNDLAVVRAGPGQLRVTARVDGVLYARMAGDGCIVSTPAGSSAYTIASGGPLLAPALRAYVLTGLPRHGGFSPPLVLDADSTLELDVQSGHGGARLELDGRAVDEPARELTVAFDADAALLVAFSDQEPHLTGLRRRGIVADSPRIVADDARYAEAAGSSSSAQELMQ